MKMASRRAFQPLGMAGRWARVTVRRGFRATSVCKEIFEVNNEAEFESKVLKNKKPVIVDFFATWCGPCKMVTPVLESAVKGREGAVDLAKVDIDKLQELAIRHQVSAVPTIVGVKDGQMLDKLIGAQGADVIEALLDSLTSQ